ncbi:MAG: hypothetical protein ACJ73S_16770 [Mycobacteriales bacterium]|jgi:hypothetical protein
MAVLVWLAAPVAVTLLAVLLGTLARRTRRPPDLLDSIKQTERFRAALSGDEPRQRRRR